MAQAIRAALLVALVLAAGCSRDMFAIRPTPQFVGAYGCDVGEIQAAEPSFMRPRPGWTACSLMMRTGMPREARVHETENVLMATWVYAGMQGRKVVYLERRERDWIVTYVGW